MIPTTTPEAIPATAAGAMPWFIMTPAVTTLTRLMIEPCDKSRPPISNANVWPAARISSGAL